MIVALYFVDFERILNDIAGQTEKALITFFIVRLREDLRSDLKITRPKSLKQAFSLAKMYEKNRVGTGVASHTIPINKPNY